MGLIEVLQSKQIDIYISLFMTILGLVLGLIVENFRRRPEPGPVQNNVTIASLTVNNVIRPQAGRNTGRSNDEGLMYAVGIFLLVSGAIYLWYRLEILNSLYYLTVFTISLWSGGILHSLFIGKYSGWRWIANLVFYAAFFTASFLVINKAITPNYAPDNFFDSQQLIQRDGVLGFGKSLSALDFKWLMFHLLGIMLLFYSMFRLTLSTTYFAIMGNYVASSENYEPWLARRTRKYAFFWENIALITILLFMSYFLVAGNFFMWFEYEFPREMELLINRVLHGS